jgi:hypothetical protein
MMHPTLTKWGKVRRMSTLASLTLRDCLAPSRVGRRRLASVAGLALAALAGCGSGSVDEESVGTPGNATPNQRSSLGYNLDFPGDWTNLPPFIDQIKNSRAPQGNCGGDDQSCDPTAHLDLDAHGWPKSLRYKDDPSLEYSSITLLINSSDQRSDLGETFVVTWEGSGEIDVRGSGNVRQEGEHRLTFQLAPEVIQVVLSDIDPGDYVRNVRVFREDFEGLLDKGEIFNPDMLKFLTPFRSIRFMDWMESNAFGECVGGSTPGEDCYAVISPECGGGGRCLMPGHWDERPTADAPSLLASGQFLDVSRPGLGTKVGGYSLETLVALANRVPADPHFNIPADFDEEYARNFARYLRDHLAVGLRATVEYSNEVWNFQFPQAQYANELGRQLWPDEGSAWVQYMAGRTHTLCGIMKDVFAGQEERLRCAISPQTGWRDLAPTVLDCPLWAADHPGEGACSEHLDAINVTGYFAGCLVRHEGDILDWLQDGRDSALDKAFEQLEHGGLFDDCTGDDEDNLDYTIEGFDYFGQLAASHGLELYVYESGTHFNFDGGDTVREFLVDMTRDPRMYDLYTKNFEGFKSAGGGIMNVWGWVAPDDMWANADSLSDLNHPKYRAIRDFAASAR